MVIVVIGITRDFSSSYHWPLCAAVPSHHIRRICASYAAGSDSISVLIPGHQLYIFICIRNIYILETNSHRLLLPTTAHTKKITVNIAPLLPQS